MRMYVHRSGKAQFTRRVPNKIGRSLCKNCQWTKHFCTLLCFSPRLLGDVLHVHDRFCPLQHTEGISDRNCGTLNLFMIEMQQTALNCDNPLKLFVTEREKKVREINDRH